MPQGMGSNVLGQAGRLRISPHHSLDGSGSQGPFFFSAFPGSSRPVMADKQIRAHISSLFQVLLNGASGLIGQKNHPGLVALASDRKFFFIQINRIYFQISQFRNPQAGGKQQFQNRPVPQPDYFRRSGFKRSFQDSFQIRAFQEINASFSYFHQFQFLSRQGLNIPLSQKLQKRAKGDDMVILGGFLQRLAANCQTVQIQPELPDFFQSNLGRVGNLGKLQEAMEIEVVIPDGQLGAIFFNLQIFQKLG